MKALTFVGAFWYTVGNREQKTNSITDAFTGAFNDKEKDGSKNVACSDAKKGTGSCKEGADST